MARLANFAWRAGTAGCLVVASTLVLAGCASAPARLAGNPHDVCGSDFGMLEQMEYDYRGNAAPVGQDAFNAC